MRWLILAGLCFVQLLGMAQKSPYQTAFDQYRDSVLNYGLLMLHDSAGTVSTASVGWAFKNQELLDSHRMCIGSVTKMFTAVLVHQLMEEDKLDAADVVSDYIDVPYPWMKGISIGSLLNHTSGIQDFNNAAELTNSALLNADFDVSDKALFAYIPDSSLAKGRQLYSNANYFMLRLILENVSGKPIESLLSERIFQTCRIPDACLSYRTIDSSLAHPMILSQDLYRYNKENLNALSRGDGNLVMNVFELNAFLRNLLIDSTLLKPKALQRMTNLSPFPNGKMAHGIFKLEIGNTKVWGHTGRQLSYICYALVKPDTKESWVFMTSNAADYYLDDLVKFVLTKTD